jgi:uncharacterized protein YjiS (DUF1127 family)
MDGPHFKEAPMTTQIATFASFVAPAQTAELRGDTATPTPFRLRRISEWWRRIRERNELTTLGHRELVDFMCSTADARAEASKWFWEV